MSDVHEMNVFPLAGIRVLDLSRGPMLRVSRLLADLGAICVQVKIGAAGDAFGFDGAEGIDERVSESVNRLGIEQLRIGELNRTGRDELEAMLLRTDILIESTQPGSDAEDWLDVGQVRRRHPQMVIMSISDFGRSTDFTRWRATTPVLHALSSELSRSGIPGRDPLVPPGQLPYDAAAAQAAMSLVTAYLLRMRTSRGCLIDFSVLDGAIQTLDPAFGVASSASAGVPLSDLPRGRPDEGHRYPIIACADGYVRLCVLAKRQWRALWEWMGSPESFADPIYDTNMGRRADPLLIPFISRFMAHKTREELEREGQARGIPTTAVLTLEEVLASDHVAARDFVQDVHLTDNVVGQVPRGLVEIDGWRAIAPDSVDKTVKAPVSVTTLNPLPSGAPSLPLTGVKVIDFGVIVVGADTARILGDLGADVIKIENSSFPDGLRVAFAGPMVQGFAAGHRNKRSFAVDLRHPEGVALVKGLVADADVVLANFKPGVLDSLGLGVESLREANPRLVIVESSAFGKTGPWSNRMGYGPLVRAAAGLTNEWVYPREPGTFSDAITAYPDHVSARIGVLAAIALLIRRERTEVGGAASVAQFEVMLSHMAPQIVKSSLRNREVTLGDVPEHDAPWGLYKAAGEDNWVAVTLNEDAQWSALCTTIGRLDLLGRPELSTRAGRDKHRMLIDDAVSKWVAPRSPQDAMEKLQTAGIPAGAMLRAADVTTSDYYAQRGLFRLEEYPFGQDAYLMEDRQIASAEIAAPPQGRAPLLGEQTADIAKEELGLSPSLIHDLVARKILELPPSEWAAAVPSKRPEL
ncbi:CoA transferase [Rhodococcus sp. 06-418-1B]|nr:CoA transferase [Rhodococcus sp. 06-418-1B]OZC83396.1 CoA transferase [Rhodococcus sp. 06-418-1B]